MTHSTHRIVRPKSTRRRLLIALPTTSASGVYQFRRKVPKDLQAALGHEYKRSLKTRDPTEARRRFAEELSKCEAAFALARAQGQGLQSLTTQDMRVLAGRWYAAQLVKMEKSEDYSSWLAEGPKHSWEHGSGREESVLMVSLRDALLEQEDFDLDAQVLQHLQATLRINNVPMPDIKSAGYARLLAIFREQYLTLGDVALKRHEGQANANVSVPQGTLSVESSKVGGLEPRLMTVFEGYAKEREMNGGEGREVLRTNAAYKKIALEFIELCGDLPIKKIDRALVAQYRSKIATLPVKGKGIRSLNANQKIAKAIAESLPTADAATIRNKLRAISAVLSYAVRMQFIAENPVIASGVGTAAAKAASRRTAAKNLRMEYNADELAGIFGSPLYAAGWTPPRADFGQAWFWMPLLMYYTGARREELAQLAVKDILSDDEAGSYLSILNTGDTAKETRTVKNAGSRRFIPLHPDLVALGLLEYKDSLPAEGPLFPKLRANPQGYFSANIGKRWAEYLSAIVGMESPASPSHGFRHTFKTLCREAGIHREVHDAFTGHSGTVGSKYGTMPLVRLADDMRLVASVPNLKNILANRPVWKRN